MMMSGICFTSIEFEEHSQQKEQLMVLSNFQCSQNNHKETFG